MVDAAFWAFVAASSLLLGAFIAETVRVPDPVVGRAMGFGAGALLAAIAYVLVPTARVDDALIWASFAAGAVVFYTADGFLERRSAKSSNVGTAIALGALLDGVPESIVLGMSVAQGGIVSFGFLFAVFLSNIPEALASTAEMRKAHSRRFIYTVWLVIVGVSTLAAAMGYAVVELLPGSDGRDIEALAAGAVLTMLTSSMIPQSFQKGGRVVALVSALGFGVAAVLTLVD